MVLGCFPTWPAREQDPSLVMASLDVDALFTSIPLDETIKICIDELFANDEIVHNLNKDEMKKLLELACKDTLFLFDGIYYNQIDGMAMGSPLGPHFANAFMKYHENHYWNISFRLIQLVLSLYFPNISGVFVLKHNTPRVRFRRQALLFRK